jgi:hypothetical protein
VPTESNKVGFEKLVEDAELVAAVGVRLGRIKGVDFLNSLSSARQALDTNELSPPVVAELQKSLNSAVKDIFPITLNDLRSGWSPFNGHPERRLGTLAFGLFCFLLLVTTAYMTQIYDRAVSLYATTLELQEARGAEQAIRLLGLLRKNQKDVVESLKSGNKDFLYEAFNKALFDLQLMNERFESYAPRAVDVLNDLNMMGRIRDWFSFPLYWVTSKAAEDSAPTNSEIINGWVKNYGKQSEPAMGVPTKSSARQTKLEADRSLPLPGADFDNLDIPSLLRIYINEVRNFTSAINVGFDPLASNNYSFYIYRLREGINFVGAWMLPWLYGMLGAVIFHMRQLLDPDRPNPSWLRFSYRIVLGGFAGIIVVWFWTPSSQKLGPPAFATLTSFGLAFLVGFSTDFFFQALDRLVSYLSQAIGQPSIPLRVES